MTSNSNEVYPGFSRTHIKNILAKKSFNGIKQIFFHNFLSGDLLIRIGSDETEDGNPVLPNMFH
jgi:hypothetical protein